MGLEVGGDKDAQILYHRIGTNQCMSPYISYALVDRRLDVAEDILVIKNADQPEWLWGAAVSVDGRWLELSISQDSSRVCSSVPLITPLTKLEIEKYALAGRP